MLQAVITTVFLAQACLAQTQNIPETAIAAGSFTTLVNFLTQANLVDTLSGPGPFTVFAPTDAAFAKLPQEIVQAVTNDPDLLRRVLLYHVVSGDVRSTDLTNDLTVNSVEGTPLRINLYNNNKATVNGKVISSVDIETTNGVIHVIDDVIFPFAENSIPELVQANDDLSTLLTALQTAGLVDALGGGPFTVFAPTNAAFAKIPQQDLQNLLNNPTELARVLRRHVVPSTVFAAGLKGSRLTTLDGEDITGRVRAKRSAEPEPGHRHHMRDGNPMLRGNRSGRSVRVVSADNIATNGVVHIIDMVL